MNARILRFSIATALVAAVAVSCAKTESEDSSAGKKRSFNAWMYVHYPQLDTTGNGIYVLEDIAGDGEEVSDTSYLFVEYEQRVLEDSSLVSYSSEELAKQAGTYVYGNYYGPEVVQMLKSNMCTGIYDMFTGGGKYSRMRVGGSRTAIIPSWLAPTSDNNVIYRIGVTNQVKYITKWEIEQLENYMKTRGIPVPDTTGHYGYYYWRDKDRELQRGVITDTISFPEDTTVYINYVGRLTDGTVFDTNIKDTAKVWGIYSTAYSYGPSSVTWASDSTSLKLGGSTVIEGFYRTLWRMHPHESAIGMFTSNYGYSTSGSGNAIKAYVPLVFEIDMVDSTD